MLEGHKAFTSIENYRYGVHDLGILRESLPMAFGILYCIFISALCCSFLDCMSHILYTAKE